jgi:predicted nucleic acid-binding protein
MDEGGSFGGLVRKVNLYLDSSVVVGWLLKEPGRLPEPESFDGAFASAVIDLEVSRALCRHLAEKRLDQEDLDRLLDVSTVWFGQIGIVPLSRAILTRAAGPFPTIVGALDAIHLATALMWREETDDDVTFLTHDRQLRAAARACRFPISRP